MDIEHNCIKQPHTIINLNLQATIIYKLHNCKTKSFIKILSYRFIKFGLLSGLIIIMTQCNYSTSNQKRFSKVMDIEIPQKHEVIKDEYQSNWQDFEIEYKIKLTAELMTELTKSIRSSRYYNGKVFVKEYVTEDMFLQTGNVKAVWAKTENGFVFYNQSERDFYSAKVDTIFGIAEFNEAHD